MSWLHLCHAWVGADPHRDGYWSPARYLLMWLLLVELLGQVATVGYSLRFLVPYVEVGVGHVRKLGHCMYLAYATAVGPRLQGASGNERTRISEPHGNTHLRQSHPGAYSGRHCIAMQGCSSVCWVSLSESTERSVECHK